MGNVNVHSPLSKRNTLIGLGVSTLLGVGIVIAGLVTWQRAQASEAWPTVRGIVRTAEVSRVRRTERNERTKYMPQVSYEYVVDDEVYVGHRIRFAQPNYSRRSGAQAVVRQYPANEPVTVYHHPTRPALAVLEPGASLGNAILLLVGVVWTLGSLGMWWMFRKYMPEDATGEAEA